MSMSISERNEIDALRERIAELELAVKRLTPDVPPPSTEAKREPLHLKGKQRGE